MERIIPYTLLSVASHIEGIDSSFSLTWFVLEHPVGDRSKLLHPNKARLKSTGNVVSAQQPL